MRYLIAVIMLVSILGCDNYTSELLPQIECAWEEDGECTFEDAWMAPYSPGRPHVKVFYVNPINALSDVEYRQRLQDITSIVNETQHFFADAMDRHGYGPKTFVTPKKLNGEVVIEQINATNAGEVRKLLDWEDGQESRDIYLLFYETNDSQLAGSGAGFPQHGGGVASVYKRAWTVGTVAHELGHAFGLMHDWRNSNYIMSYGVGATAPDSELSSAAAGWLNQHHAFNEGTVDMRFDTGVGSFRLISKTPRADGQLDLVFSCLSGGTVFADYVPNGNLDWVFTYGIFYDNKRDTVITEIPREAFSVQVVNTPDAEVRITYRLQFTASVPKGLKYFSFFVITDTGYVSIWDSALTELAGGKAPTYFDK